MFKKKGRIFLSIAAFLLVFGIVLGGTYAYYVSKTDVPSISASTGSVDIELIESFPADSVVDNTTHTVGGSNKHYLDDENAIGSTTKDKVFWGVATGSKKSVVRAMVFKSIEYFDTVSKKWMVAGNIPSSYIEGDYAGSNKWVYNAEDGYYYYSDVLDGNISDTKNNSNLYYKDSQSGTVLKNQDYQLPTSYIANSWTTEEFKLNNIRIDDTNQTVKLDVKQKDFLQKYKIRINVLVTLETSQATNGEYLDNWGISTSSNAYNLIPEAAKLK